MEQLRILVRREVIRAINHNDLSGRIGVLLPKDSKLVKVSLEGLFRDGELLAWSCIRPLGIFLETPGNDTFSPASLAERFGSLKVEIVEE